ncbi:YdcF family protein [Aneurinibacillus sp. REN35]|uniref:YdcF family protein n=1 Tax=Aneurinibacillus sp. REN35 TaxID=3237286 RepID=UPI00352838F1
MPLITKEKRATKRHTLQKRLVLLVCALFLIPVFYAGAAHLAIMNTAKQHPSSHAAYMMILGAGLWGERMSPSLQYRMDTGLSYLKQNPQTKVIVTGGQGVGEDLPEAVAMQRYLVDNGIAPERILVEDKAQTTAENIRFSKPLMKSDHVVIVTNDFHVLRAKLLAERAGMTVETLAAPTPDSVKAKLFMREYAALLKSWWFD